MLLGGWGLFYLVVWFSKIPLSSIADAGLLLGPFPQGGMWNFPYSVVILDQIEWKSILYSAVAASPVLVVAVMSLLLNASGMEMIPRRDINLHRELSVSVLRNLLSGFVGGIPAYQSISLSSLNFQMSGGRIISAVVASILCGLMLMLGAYILEYVPKILVGIIVVYLGLSMLIEWVYKTWFKFPLVEYLVVILILGVIAFFGFLLGVVVGVIAAIILFVVSYSRTDVVKHSLSGMNFRSRVTRSPDQQRVLSEQGERLYILQLQGFIFFGTANKLLEQVREGIEQMDTKELCFVLLDFRQVTGLDSTAMLSFAKMKQFVADHNVSLVVTDLSPTIYKQFTNSNFIDEGGSVIEFSNLDRGLDWCEDEILKGEAGAVDERYLGDYLEEIYPHPQHIKDLLAAMQQKQINEGFLLIQQGEEADTLFFVENGQVITQLELTDGEPIRLETMRGGRMVGEVGFYLGSQRTASVKADEDSTVFAFSTQDLNELKMKNPHAPAAFHRIVASLLAERAVHLTNTVQALQRKKTSS